MIPDLWVIETLVYLQYNGDKCDAAEQGRNRILRMMYELEHYVGMIGPGEG